MWRPWDSALCLREASTWLFRLRAPAWPCCLSGCFLRNALPWSALFPLSLRPFPVLWCKRRRVCVWSTPPSRAPDLGRLSSSAVKTASGWASRRPPAPAYQDLSLLKDTQDVQVRGLGHIHKYVYRLHPRSVGSRAGRLNKKTMVRQGRGSLRVRALERKWEAEELNEAGEQRWHGGDGERSGGAALISERKSRVKSLLLRQLLVQLTWKERRRGEGSESRGSAGGKDHITLRTSKQSRQKKKQEAGWFSQELCSSSV